MSCYSVLLCCLSTDSHFHSQFVLSKARGPAAIESASTEIQGDLGIVLVS